MKVKFGDKITTTRNDIIMRDIMKIMFDTNRVEEEIFLQKKEAELRERQHQQQELGLRQLNEQIINIMSKPAIKFGFVRDEEQFKKELTNQTKE